MTVDIRYNLGFERMVRAAIENFRKMGLRPVIYRYALSTVNRRGNQPDRVHRRRAQPAV